MSAGAVVAIAVGGAVVVAAAIIWLVVWLNRSNKAQGQAAAGKLAEESARRGWTYAERDDSVAELYTRQHREFALPNLLHPLADPPAASAARDVITGTHRGRPFVAAVVDTSYLGELGPELCVWVRTPAPRPSLTVRKVAALQSRANSAIGRGDVRTGHPEFDDRFEVSSEDPRFAAAAMSPALIGLLLAEQRRLRGIMLFADHVDALDQITDHRDPAQLLPALDLRCDIIDRIPTAVWA
ncbi:MAG TPA: hypothetical protein VHC18_12950 [Amycolatopsis sp.]|nr:hypothetical protein [Amycolatopsis sp.]